MDVVFFVKLMKEFIDQYFEPIMDMFFRVGIKSVTMDNICSEPGISKRTWYQKFSNKDQLVNEIFHRDFYNFRSKVKSVQSFVNTLYLPGHF